MKRVQIFVSIAMALALPVACYQSSDAMREQPYAEQDGGKAERDSKQDAQAQPVLDRIQVSGSRVARAEEEKQNADAASSTTLHRDDTGNQQLASEPAPAPSTAQVGQIAYRVLSPKYPTQKEMTRAPVNREGYAELVDNSIRLASEQPISTFSVDVDTGSYSNVRRMIEQGQLPPANAVRAEEFINYFDYGYQPPDSLKQPFSVSTELAPAPWNARRVLMQIGIKGYELPKSKTPPINLVFLIDTSGSMQSADKIDLLKAAFKQMLPELRRQDRVAIVAYAGSAGMVLAPTPGDHRETIAEALDQLQAGGSTNGAAGIELAYQLAEQSRAEGSINRVILATDGDFNVGTVSLDALKSMIAEKRKSGVALSTLGFGQGNYQDETAEQLADVGNGNHAYIDSLDEARKVLVEEIGGTLVTIAKDVKIQIEFNPALVAEYRLIGYENRILQREDFNNDRVDAGEIGAGHDVTALYELSLVDSGASASDPLRYGESKPLVDTRSGELAWLKLRYKQPDAEQSTLIERPIHTRQIAQQSSDRLAFAAAVAAYADLLRGGTHVANFDYAQVQKLAQRGLSDDDRGYRAQFLTLVSKTEKLGARAPGQEISMQ